MYWTREEIRTSTKHDNMIVSNDMTLLQFGGFSNRNTVFNNMVSPAAINIVLSTAT